MAVVVPARDEAERLEACLDALRWSTLRLRHAIAPASHAVTVSVVLVLDACTDASASVAAGFDEFTVIAVDERNVGAARAHGVAAALAQLGGDPARTWIASTDADSTVPPSWLLDHLDHADAGADVVLGSVVPVRAELAPARAIEWDRRHPDGAARGTVHGANLGIRASAYLGVGGFRALTVHEDVALVDALRSHAAVVVDDLGAPVITSGRALGRAPGGYTDYLRSLDSLTDA